MNFNRKRQDKEAFQSQVCNNKTPHNFIKKGERNKENQKKKKKKTDQNTIQSKVRMNLNEILNQISQVRAEDFENPQKKNENEEQHPLKNFTFPYPYIISFQHPC